MRIGKASLRTSLTEIPLAVPAVLIISAVAGLDACVTVIALDVAAAQLGLVRLFLGRPVTPGIFKITAIRHGHAFQRRIALPLHGTYSV